MILRTIGFIYTPLRFRAFCDWNKEKRYKPFSGAVLVTDKKLSSGIQNIAEGIVIKPLSVERGGKNAEMP